MTRLLWDQAGTKRFETGCDRGVLYLPQGGAVPWNGITSVTEDNSEIAIERFYMDGRKYLDRRVPGDFLGTLSALTYPVEFQQFEGLGEMVQGVFGTSQYTEDIFGLCYRTRVGNDELAEDYGYRLHLLYNLTAKPDNKTFPTIASSVNAEEFTWSIMGVPIDIPGFRPAAHIIVDSTLVPDGYLMPLEDILYGTDTTDPNLPGADVLMGLHFDGGITEPITEPV